MKNNLDNLINQNLKDRTYEFKDTYWLEAEKLIVAQEKKKRRVFFIWWFGGVMALSVLIGGIYYFNSDNQHFAEKNPTENKERLQEKSPEKQITINESGKQIESQSSTISNEENLEEKEAISEFGQISSKVIDPSTERIQKENSKRNNEKQEAVFKLKDKIIPSQNKNSSKKEVIDSAQIETIKNKQPIANQAIILKEEIKPENIDEKQISAFKRLQIAQMFHLPLLKNQLSFPWTKPKPKTKSQKEIEKEYEEESKSHKWLLGITGGLGFYKTKNNSGFQNDDWHAGLAAGYRITPEFAILGELSYRKYSSEFEVAAESIQNTQAFGLDKDRYTLVPENLHYLEVPIYGQYSYNKHRIEAGLSSNFLTGAKGSLFYEDQLFPWQRTDEENLIYQQQIEQIQAQEPSSRESIEPFRKSVKEESGWIQTEGIRKFQAFGMLGYRFSILKHLDIGVRAKYRLFDYYSTESGLKNDQNKWSFQISGFYYFKN